MPDITVNLVAFRPGIDLHAFRRFATEIDQPTCIQAPSLLSIAQYEVTPDPRLPTIGLVEVLEMTSREKWAVEREQLPGWGPMNSTMQQFADFDRSIKLFGTAIGPQSISAS